MKSKWANLCIQLPSQHLRLVCNNVLIMEVIVFVTHRKFLQSTQKRVTIATKVRHDPCLSPPTVTLLCNHDRSAAIISDHVRAHYSDSTMTRSTSNCQTSARSGLCRGGCNRWIDWMAPMMNIWTPDDNIGHHRVVTIWMFLNRK